MVETGRPAAPPRSLLATTIRRSMTVGLRFLVMGVLFSLLLTGILLRSRAFVTVFPLELPFFAILGSLGGLVLFVDDRTKGVFEYLISYGVSPGRLFGYALAAGVALASIVLGAALAVGLGGYVAEGGGITWALGQPLLLYAVPMTYACTLFALMVSMVWSALASPRAGMGGPLGIAPMLGEGPAILVLVAAETAPHSAYYLITAGGAGVILVAVALLAAGSGRLLGRERLLSQM